MTTDQSPPVPAKRSWFQFSIKALLGLVAFVALGCAALLNASLLWSVLMFHATVAVLLIAVLRGVFRDGSVRAFWLGFALFGCVYVLLAFWPADWPVEGYPTMGYQWVTGVAGHLLTSKLSELAYMKLLPLVRPPPPSMVTATQAYPDLDTFVLVAHWVWTWLLALLGGLVARYFYATRERET